MVTRRTVLAGSATAALGWVAGCSPVSSPAPPTSSATVASTPPPPTPSATPSSTPTESPRAQTPAGPPRPAVSDVIAEDLDVPWGLVFLPSGDALVSERGTARLLRVTPRGKVTEVGVVAGVAAPDGTGEGGLLGIALDPDDPDTLFAYITTTSDNRVVRLGIKGGTRRPKVLVPGIPTNPHHHGGRLLFDADGLLYVSTGDAEQSELAQDRSSLAGKILRIRPDGRAAPGNPFDNRTWSYGHRNIEGLAWDQKGRLWATEFGEKEADELNLIARGRNYGWPRVEGRSDDDAYVAPAAVWSPTSACSPAGLAITRSTAFVAALQGRCLFSVPLDGRRAGQPKKHFAGDYGRVRNVVTAPDGSLWMTTSNTDGRVTPRKNDDRILRVTL
jgi:glucose/arabinose dehydrogenase